MGNRNKVYVKRTFRCDAETLFDWLTSPTLIAQWFGPEGFETKHAMCDPVQGGKYRFSLYKMDKYCFSVLGNYLEVNRPAFLSFSYEYEDLEARPSSTVSFSLTEANGATQLEMVQEFVIETPDFAKRTEAWKYMFERLGILLRS